MEIAPKTAAEVSVTTSPAASVEDRLVFKGADDAAAAEAAEAVEAARAIGVVAAAVEAAGQDLLAKSRSAFGCSAGKGEEPFERGYLEKNLLKECNTSVCHTHLLASMCGGSTFGSRAQHKEGEGMPSARVVSATATSDDCCGVFRAREPGG